MYVIIAGISIHFLLRRGGRTRRWQHQITLWYTLAMLVVSTIYYISGAKWSEVEFVESTVNPGVFATLLSNPLAICKDTAFTVNIWLADSLIIYRLYCIWQSNIYVVLFPIIVYLASVACSIELLIQTAKPGGNLGQSSVINFGIPTWSLSVALNNLNRKSGEYASVAVIFIESAAAYSITGLVYIPLFAKKIPLAFPFTALWGSVTVIAPQIIILRIALGIDIVIKPRSTSNSLPSSSGNTGQGSTTRIEERSFQSPITKNSPDGWMDGKPQQNTPQIIHMKPMKDTAFES
ncbi:hypothetical protein BU17DRAFT_68359 [Hysterangium stoloniferum]|nr:hypothetical protein BU17DRAFT_68359 [Hysterangium stoloniferum]